MVLLTDSEIKEAMEKGEIKMESFEPKMLQSASYDMRIGAELLISGTERNIDLGQQGSINLKAGQFALVTTQENITLAKNMVAHIGLKSYYVRKGIVVLAGLQIDPGFSGVLILGIYNASSRSVNLEYLNSICTIEFYRLAKPVEIPFNRTELDEQKEGRIPRVDREYLKTLETQSLSEMSQAVKQLSINVDSLTSYGKIGIGLGVTIIGGIILSAIVTSPK